MNLELETLKIELGKMKSAYEDLRCQFINERDDYMNEHIELQAERALTAKLQEDLKAQRKSWMEERKLFSRDSSRMAKESNFLHAEKALLTSEISRLVKALDQALIYSGPDAQVRLEVAAILKGTK